LRGCNVGTIDERLHKYAAEMDSGKKSVQAFKEQYGYCCNNLRSCNAGTTD
jgi:hypothetical protein